MSLDFYLVGPEVTETITCSECERPYEKISYVTHYAANITHNLHRMADAAGIYNCLWHPDEHGFTHAHQVIEPLAEGLKFLRARPEHFRQFHASNGWGMYEHFVPFVSEVLHACRQYPDARVKVSR